MLLVYVSCVLETFGAGGAALSSSDSSLSLSLSDPSLALLLGRLIVKVGRGAATAEPIGGSIAVLVDA